MKCIALFILMITTIGSVGLAQDKKDKFSFPALKGPYLGQKPPGKTAEKFAPDIIETGLNVRDITISPDGKELYFSTNTSNHSFSTIYFSEIKNGIWSKPRVAQFARDSTFRFGEPFIAPDGNKMYFISTKPVSDLAKSDYNVWVMDKEQNSWGVPRPLGTPINSELNEFYPSVTRDGTIYFTRTIPSHGTYIFRSRLINGVYSQPERLEKNVNSTHDQYNAFVAPDESYLIVPNGQRTDSYGGTDYYVCFRNKDDTWSEPYNLGAGVNSRYAKEWSSYVSPDGKYFFFMSDRGPDNAGRSKIFWVEAHFIEKLRPKK